MNKIMQVFTDAWNYFPHKELGGKASNDLFQESLKTFFVFAELVYKVNIRKYGFE